MRKYWLQRFNYDVKGNIEDIIPIEAFDTYINCTGYCSSVYKYDLNEAQPLATYKITYSDDGSVPVYDKDWKRVNNNSTKDNVIEPKEAYWVVWDGWSGNHDRRIDDAKCTNCGYIHPTVYNSLDNLSKTCLSCKSVMSVFVS